MYEPVHHKNAHHGHKRTIYIGPKAQGVIKPFLSDRPVDTYLFRAVEAEAERRAQAHKLRKTPLESGNSPGTNRKRAPNATLQNHYTTSSYRQAIQRACDKAGIPPWHPHQLRHNAATRLRAEFGLEGAQLILGHRKADVTEVYAELDQRKALDIIARVG
jgi:integrase